MRKIKKLMVAFAAAAGAALTGVGLGYLVVGPKQGPQPVASEPLICSPCLGPHISLENGQTQLFGWAPGIPLTPRY